MSQLDTKNLILDVAERLFARNGFHNTSLRAITGEAGVNLAAVNYHFGSKEALLEAVFERRILPLNKIRKERLEKVRENARNENHRPGVEETLRAFIEPTLHLKDSEPGAEDFISLVGRSLVETDTTGKETLIRNILPIYLLLFETLCEALPGLSRNLVCWRLQFVIGTMRHLMCGIEKNLNIPLEGVNFNQDTDSIIAMLIPFITSGMEAP